MPKLNDDGSISVDLDDDAIIQVEVTGDAADDAVVKAAEPKEAEPKVTKVKRVSPDADDVHVKALADATAYAKTQEDARKAAEATANSERSLREDAQRRAQEAQQREQELRERAESGELAILDSGIESAQRELETQKDAYTRAAEAGEFAKMGDIQVKISKAAAALDRLEDAKSSYVSTSKTTEGRVTEQSTAPNKTDVFLSNFAPKAQAWLRQHPDCLPAAYGGDNVKNSKMMSAHYSALAQNIAEGSDDYYKFLEQNINPVEAKVDDTVVIQPKTAERKQAQVSAPVSREPENPNQPRQLRSVKLSKEQQEMARMSFPHVPENQAYGMYAKNLIELESEGKIGRVTH